MAYYGSRFSLRGALSTWVGRLIAANLVVFAVALLGGRGFLVDWFSFQPADAFTRPWGVATYMFVHVDFLHVFFNLVTLFFFGPPLEAKWGGSEFLRFYLVCGLGGALFSIFFSDASIIGASAAIYGVMLAFAMNWPDMSVLIWGIIPVKAKWLVAGLTVIAVFYTAGGSQAGTGVAHFAHLGGLVIGYLYLKLDWRTPNLDGFRRGTQPRKLTLVPRETRIKAKKASRRKASPPAAPAEEAILDRVDRVLDKISAEGMDALTAEERALLDEVSRRHRTN